MPGRKRAGTAEHRVEIALDAGQVRLRGLIDAVVRAEVAAFRRRAEEQTFVRVLTEQALADGLSAGTVRTGSRDVPTDVDVDEAVRAALTAFGDGLYKVIVDDEPVVDLDDALDLAPDTRLLFLRLVPLAGG